MRWYAIAGAALGLAAGGYAAGRFSAPDRVQVKTVDRVVYQDRVVTKTVTVQAEAKTQTVYRDRTVITHKDGTVERRDIERDTASDRTVARQDNTRSEEKVKISEHTAEKIIERNRPQWRVGAMAGIDLRARSPVYGGIVERRILGPFSLGAWGLSSGAAGVALTMEF